MTIRKFNHNWAYPSCSKTGCRTPITGALSVDIDRASEFPNIKPAGEGTWTMEVLPYCNTHREDIIGYLNQKGFAGQSIHEIPSGDIEKWGEAARKTSESYGKRKSIESKTVSDGPATTEDFRRLKERFR